MLRRLGPVIASAALSAPFGVSHCSGGGGSGGGDSGGDGAFFGDVLSGLSAETAADAVRQRLSAAPEFAAAEVGAGGLLGFATGFAAKRVGKVLLFGVGSVFALQQQLSSAGWVEVKYDVVEADMERYLDQDGDGKLTASDLDAMQRRAVLFLSAGLPAGSGFSAGLFLGLRS